MRSMFMTLAVMVMMTVTLSHAEGQRRSGMRQQPRRYDTASEVTVRGTVQEVKQVDDGMGMRYLKGTHVVLKTDQETIEVRLGSSTFLAEQNLSLSSGDTLEIVGSRVNIGEAEAIIAREVRKGDNSVTLRDADGIPKWSRGPRR